MSDYLHSCLLWVAVGCVSASAVLLVIALIAYVTA